MKNISDDYNDAVNMDIEEAAMDVYFEEQVREEYEEKLVNNALGDISEENVRDYLGKYGDAVEERIKFCLDRAKALNENNYFGASLILSVIVIELIIRFLLLRPLVQGAFLSDDWAGELIKRIMPSKAGHEKKLLCFVLKKWDIDITKRRISDKNAPLWETMQKKIRPKRNNFVHRASPINEQESLIALECANAFMQIAKEVAENLGFTLSKTGKWCEIDEGKSKRMKEKDLNVSFEPESPFSSEK